jgi:hypothetical protein
VFLEGNDRVHFCAHFIRWLDEDISEDSIKVVGATLTVAILTNVFT